MIGSCNTFDMKAEGRFIWKAGGNQQKEGKKDGGGEGKRDEEEQI